MAITYFGGSSTPADNGTNTANPTIVTPPANMLDNDFVIIIACSADTSGTLSISETGGQTWTALTQQNTSRNITNIFWCDFNGTWTADPSVTMAGTSNNIVIMHVFRTTDIGRWHPDVAEVSGIYAAPSNPYTVTINGITTQADNTVAIAVWTSKDDNTWSDASGGSWANLGETQYRNTSGSYDQSVTAAYVVMPTAGATGDVSKNQTNFGGDAGNKYIIAFHDPVEFDGFEVGDANLTNGDGAFWDSGYDGGGGATLVGNDTTIVDSGTYSAKATLTAAGQTVWTYHIVVANNNTYAQIRFYIASMTGNATQSTSLIQFRNSTTQRCYFKVHYKTSGTFTIDCLFGRDGGTTTLTGTTVYNTGEWYTGEMRYFCDAAAGGAQIWVNGSLELSDLAKDTDFANNQPTRIYVGAGDAAWYGVHYLDNFKYDTAYIGIAAAWIPKVIMVM